MNLCPECSNHLIEDPSNGEYVCSRCGYVVEDSMPSLAPDFISSSLEEKMRNMRYGAPLSYSRHDNGLSTEIANTNKDFSGNKIDAIVSEQMNNVKRWHSITRRSSSKDRRLSNVLARINWLCETLSLPKVVNETAALLYRNYESNNEAKNKIVISIALAFVCLACRKIGILKSLHEIAYACNINEDRKISLAARYYRELLMNNKDKDGCEANNTISKYIAKVVNLLKLDIRVTKLALELASKTNIPLLTSGKNPNGFAAAYIYISTVLLGIDVQEKDITSAADITETTLRKRYNEIINRHKVRLIVKSR